MRPEIKNVCNELIEDYSIFDYDDAVVFCKSFLDNMELCYFEFVDALHYIIIGLEIEQEDCVC